MKKILLSAIVLAVGMNAASIEDEVKDALINSTEHTLSGTFGKHDFADAEDAFDWAFTTSGGVSYQLRGNEPSETDAFGWKAAGDIATPTPEWYMFAVDIDGDGIKGKFEWVLLSADMSNKSAYKLAGANDNGTFAYSNKLDIDYMINGNSIQTGAAGSMPESDVIDTSAGGLFDFSQVNLVYKSSGAVDIAEYFPR